MAFKFLALLGVVASCTGSVLMEVTFDLALQQESETGYTASHTVEEYLKDSNLHWLRYLNTLVSGNPGGTPMRTAFMEFKDYNGWTQFETTNMERTHILYDLFWINSKKVLWENHEALTVKGERGEDKAGGFLYVFRYGMKDGKAQEGADWLDNKLKAVDMTSNEGFLERRAFSNGLWQDEFEYLLWFEFHDMASLSKSMYEDTTVMDLLVEAKSKYFSKYATSIMVPSAGSQGGQFFEGGASA